MDINKILVVDDEPDQLETICRGLRHQGFTDIHCVLSGGDALALLSANEAQLDLVITDYRMPEMDGLELVRRIREAYPELPVVMMTAYMEKDLVSRALDNKCTGFIEKPFIAEKLLEEIKSIEITRRWGVVVEKEQEGKIMAEKNELNEHDEDLYDDDEDAQKDKYLTFHLAGEDYGVEIKYVTEIIGIQKITEVPDMPDFVRGVINLRGKVIPVMDVRIRFHLAARDYDERTCIIVVDINETSVGLVVDEVREVANIPEKDVEPAPATGNSAGSRYIQGMGKIDAEVKILLNVGSLLYGEELEQLSDAA